MRGFFCDDVKNCIGDVVSSNTAATAHNGALIRELNTTQQQQSAILTEQSRSIDHQEEVTKAQSQKIDFLTVQLNQVMLQLTSCLQVNKTVSRLEHQQETDITRLFSINNTMSMIKKKQVYDESHIHSNGIAIAENVTNWHYDMYFIIIIGSIMIALVCASSICYANRIIDNDAADEEFSFMNNHQNSFFECCTKIKEIFIKEPEVKNEFEIIPAFDDHGNDDDVKCCC